MYFVYIVVFLHCLRCFQQYSNTKKSVTLFKVKTDFIFCHRQQVERHMIHQIVGKEAGKNDLSQFVAAAD